MKPSIANIYNVINTNKPKNALPWSSYMVLLRDRWQYSCLYSKKLLTLEHRINLPKFDYGKTLNELIHKLHYKVSQGHTNLQDYMLKFCIPSDIFALIESYIPHPTEIYIQHNPKTFEMQNILWHINAVIALIISPLSFQASFYENNFYHPILGLVHSLKSLVHCAMFISNKNGYPIISLITPILVGMAYIGSIPVDPTDAIIATGAVLTEILAYGKISNYLNIEDYSIIFGSTSILLSSYILIDLICDLNKEHCIYIQDKLTDKLNDLQEYYTHIQNKLTEQFHNLYSTATEYFISSDKNSFILLQEEDGGRCDTTTLQQKLLAICPAGDDTIL